MQKRPKVTHNRHQHLAKINMSLLRPLLHKNGFQDENIILHWPQIVGEYLAQFAFPLKVIQTSGTQYGCLLIEVSNPGFALELQAMESTIVERIATYLGCKTIFRIKTIVAKSQSLPKALPTAVHIAHKSQDIAPQTAASIEEILQTADQEIADVLKSIYKQLFKI